MSACLYCWSELTDDGGTFLRCRACASLTAKEPAPAYPDGYHAHRWSWLRPKLWYLGLKARACGLRRGLTVLDLGCGAGHALWWAKRMGCRTHGWDELAVPRVGTCDEFNRIMPLASGCCDLVWCWHTLEHSDEPGWLLGCAAEALRKGGRFYLETPYLPFLMDAPDWPANCLFPEHRGVPSAAWALGLCRELGLRHLASEHPNEGRWLYGWPRQLSVRLVFEKI